MNPPDYVTNTSTQTAEKAVSGMASVWPAGFALPALLVLLTFICATGFYIADRPIPAARPALPAELANHSDFQIDTAAAELAATLPVDIDDNAEEAVKSNTYLNKPVVLTLNSRIIESFATTRYPARLTLFPERDQFQSLFSDAGRLRAFFDTGHAYAEQIVSQLQTEITIESSSRQPLHNNTTDTAMMLEYLGTGFPNVGTWLDRFASFDEVAAHFSYRDIPQALLPEQFFRPLLTQQALPNVRCNGHSAEIVNRRADRYRKRVEKLASRYAVDPNLILAVAAQESCFARKAISPVGAQGLMQLMPATASMLGVRDAYNADDNLKGGVRYLSMLQKQFDSQELVLAAYNAGPGSVRRFNGIPPYSETQRYVVKVLSFYRSFAAADDDEAAKTFF